MKVCRDCGRETREDYLCKQCRDELPLPGTRDYPRERVVDTFANECARLSAFFKTVPL